MKSLLWDTERKSQRFALWFEPDLGDFSPLYFKTAHSFEGGCSEKFTPHLPLCEPIPADYSSA